MARAYWPPPQGFPPSPSTGNVVVGKLLATTGATAVATYTPPVDAGIEVKFSLVLSGTCTVSVYVDWTDTLSNARKTVMLPESSQAPNAVPLVSVLLGAQAGAAVTLYVQASVANVCAVTGGIEELV